MTLLLLLKTPITLKTLRYRPAHDTSLDVSALKEYIKPLVPAPTDAWGLRINRRLVADEDCLPVNNDYPIDVEIYARLRGGKGGFGTLLRGKGSRGPKTNNFESSRDLEGRRLRTARAPERMRQWVERKVQEHEIIKAVGGEDAFIGKKLSSKEVIRLYSLKIPKDSHDPFEEIEEPDEQQAVRAEAVAAAAAAIRNIASSAEPLPSRHEVLSKEKDSYLDSFLDIEDF